MDKEPKDLVAARALLKKSEKGLEDPNNVVFLKEGINSLVDVISGECAEDHKNVAKKLVVTYRNKVLGEVKAVLANANSYVLETLEHWNVVMEVFIDTGLADDPDFKAWKEQLFTKWGVRLVQSLKPWEIEVLKRELQKKTAGQNE